MVIKNRACDTCAGEDVYSNLIVCQECHVGAEHFYCMHYDEQSELNAKLKDPKDWKCQVCLPREGTDKLVQDDVEVAARRKKGRPFGSSTNCESSKGSTLKIRSSCAGKSGENSAHLSAKRYQVLLNECVMKKARDSPLSEDVSSKELKKSKIKSLNEIIYFIPERSSGETSFSGPSFCNTDAVKSSGQLHHRLQASNHNTHKDPNCPNEKKKNVNQQGEQTTKAATAMSTYKLCIHPASDEGTCLRDSMQVETAFLSHRVVIPEADPSWLGKFQIHSSEGIAGTWDGIQAHLSNCSSPTVVKMASRLLKIIILEELPRLRLWPSQFMGNQVTEDNIGLFFFASDDDSYICYKQLLDHMIENDLALKGNVDEIELLIFPSNILPEGSQRWNQMFFLWGVFRGRKVDISATTPVSNSLKVDNGHAAKSLPFDLNAYPQDGDDVEIVDKIPAFDLNAYPQDGEDMEIADENPEIDGVGDSGDRVLLIGENSNSKGGEVNVERAAIDINVPLCPESGTPENGSDSVRVEDINVEVPLTSLPLAPPSTILDPTDWKAVEDLIFFSKGKF